MTSTRATTRIERIFHPTDFTPASDMAFNHALKLAIALKADLTILHTDEVPHDRSWSEFPRVRQTLERWRLLPPNSPREAIYDLGVDVAKVTLPPGDPARSMVRYLRKPPHDLIVLATHQRDGLDRWLHASIAEPVARRAAEMTLFIPYEAEGIVSDADGRTRLTEVLVPASRVPDPQFAVDAATSMAEALGCQKVPATLLHGDYWPGNIAVVREGRQIVFDWQMASVGPAVLDVLTFVTKSQWWFGELPLEPAELVALYRQTLVELGGVEWSDDDWQTAWEHARMWRFLQEWVDLLAASPDALLGASTEALERLWLEPVSDAVSARLGAA